MSQSQTSEVLEGIDLIATKLSGLSKDAREHPLTVAVLAMQALADGGFELERHYVTEAPIESPVAEVHEWVSKSDE